MYQSLLSVVKMDTAVSNFKKADSIAEKLRQDPIIWLRTTASASHCDLKKNVRLWEYRPGLSFASDWLKRGGSVAG